MADPELTVTCTDEERRRTVADPASTHNGIDWVEIDSADQRILRVGFLHPLPGQAGAIPVAPAPVLTVPNVVVEGGERIRQIATTAVAAADRVLTVTVDRPGDFSRYTLRIVRSPADRRAPPGYDPALSAAVFSFKANCPSDLDCHPADLVLPGTPPELLGDYLAKDYDGFRRLMLDRLSLQMPGWTERNPADPLVTVVEALAHSADLLSYRQDAAATEMYLGTARSRVSVRRHARLLDYRMHDGCTARVWLHVAVAAGSDVETKGLDAGTTVLAAGGELASVGSAAGDELVGDGAIAFRTLDRLVPSNARNEITIHTWGGMACCLPAGSTRATLDNTVSLGLASGDFLLFQQVRSPISGRIGDADPSLRHVVRLVDVEPSVDPIEQDRPLLDVRWAVADALPFALTVTSEVPGDGVGTSAICAVARGNLVLAHHARSLTTTLDPVADRPRWRPVLTDQPLAFAEPVPADAPATGLLRQDPRRSLPSVDLTAGADVWKPRVDLLASDRFDRGFVVEIERDGRARLRFGDDVHGMRPAIGTAFTASFCAGGGAAGNVGRDVLTTVVTDVAGVEAVTNPVAATGGTDPESMREVRQFAPAAFKTQERAVTEADWVAVATRHPEIQNASARLRWTGSWWTVFLTVDLVGGRRLSEQTLLAARLAGELDRFRVAGYDLELRDPVDVPVMLELTVCLSSGVFRSDVFAALSAALSNQGSGQHRGFFHPDNFTFGQHVYVSQIVATAMGVAGVRSARVTELHPVGVKESGEISNGVLTVGDLEVIRLDNDPSIPERGTLRLVMEGGL